MEFLLTKRQANHVPYIFIKNDDMLNLKPAISI